MKLESNSDIIKVYLNPPERRFPLFWQTSKNEIKWKWKWGIGV
jgi:hypothetical protein